MDWRKGFFRFDLYIHCLVDKQINAIPTVQFYVFINQLVFSP